MSDTVYIATNGVVRQESHVYHTDAACPRLNKSRAVERASLRDDYTECAQCAGTVEQPETHRKSLRTLLESGEVDAE